MKKIAKNGIWYYYHHHFEWKMFELTVSQRPSSNYMGRFGGGWQWQLGVQMGDINSEWGFSVIINLLVMSVRIRYNTKLMLEEKARKKEKADEN